MTLFIIISTNTPAYFARASVMEEISWSVCDLIQQNRYKHTILFAKASVMEKISSSVCDLIQCNKYKHSTSFCQSVSDGEQTLQIILPENL